MTRSQEHPVHGGGLHSVPLNAGKKKKDSQAALRHNYGAGVRLGYENANERSADVI